jgi:hypothetical protein
MGDPFSAFLGRRAKSQCLGGVAPRANAMADLQSGDGTSSLERWFPDVDFVGAERRWGVKLDYLARGRVLLRFREATLSLCRMSVNQDKKFQKQLLTERRVRLKRLSKIAQSARALGSLIEEYEAAEIGWPWNIEILLSNPGIVANAQTKLGELARLGEMAGGHAHDVGEVTQQSNGPGRRKGSISERKLALEWIIFGLWEICVDAGGAPSRGGWNSLKKNRVTAFARGAHSLLMGLPEELFGKFTEAAIGEYVYVVARRHNLRQGNKGVPPQ